MVRYKHTSGPAAPPPVAAPLVAAPPVAAPPVAAPPVAAPPPVAAGSDAQLLTSGPRKGRGSHLQKLIAFETCKGAIFLPGNTIRPTAKPPRAKVRRTCKRWTDEEEASLRHLVAVHGEKWPAIAEQLGTERTAAAVEQHWSVMHGEHPSCAQRATAAPAADDDDDGDAVASARRAYLRAESESAAAEPQWIAPECVVVVHGSVSSVEYATTVVSAQAVD